MSHTQALDIAQVSKLTGLPASTLRYYEEKGLIRSVGRDGLKRLFTPDVLQRLEVISLGRKVGFSLDVIATMFTPNDVKIDKALLLEKADELDKNIKHLTAMRDGLRHAAECPEPTLLECPTFQRILHLSGKAQAKEKKKHKSSGR
ncbi:helix-turn-helix domain-containing protein [Terasakiella pusilla]|jgi:DNA-binding transcriptional MerR regulator|uniref:helix-turn-helix domain-containing protein n=1 Tax=Terasakiella pusilla TaxID=64973 RepID=UPI00048C3D3D|nr:helix-turn-helix domain-containing protein [Terasakiella pusilla]